MADFQNNEHNDRFLSPGEVSVNTRGGKDDDLSKKIIFVSVIVGVLVVAGVYAFNQWRDAERAKKARATPSVITDNQSSQPSRRIFDTLKPEPKPSQPECKDIVLLDKSGKPMMGKDGEPIKIACDGKIVPEINFNDAPRMVAPVAPVPNRYSGDIFVEGSTEQDKTSPLSVSSEKNPAAEELEVKTSKLSRVTASKIGNRNFILAKGAHIDCALTTKVISDIAGFASCLLTNNIYSDNGKVLLLERGSDVQGEYAATMDQGQRRLFVMWTRIKTPNGVVINLDSPAADGLGSMGLDGYVDNHWWERLGAAFLLSFVKDAIAYQTAKDSAGAGLMIYQNSVQTGNQMADRILSNTINIKPTFYKNQGDRASIYVARDLDFSTVYALRAE